MQILKGYKYLYGFYIAAFLILTVFGFINGISAHRPQMIALYFCSAGIFLFNVCYLFATRNKDFSTWIALGQLLLLFSFLVVEEGAPTTLFWIVIIPLTTFYTKGIKAEFIVSGLFFLYFIILLLLDSFGILTLPLPNPIYYRLALVYTMVVFMTYFYERTSYRRQKEIEHQLFYDQLTGLPKRSRLLRDLDGQNPSALFLINVDNFQEINDLFGGKFGDKVLKDIAFRLQNACKECGTASVYRLHADEYSLLLLDEGLSKKDLLRIAMLIQNSLSFDFNIDGTVFHLTVTLGIAEHGEELLENADIALKLAKKKGKSFLFFNRELGMPEKFRSNIEMIYKLKGGLASYGIVPFFQPILDNRTGEVCKYECLARLWDNNEYLNPSQFMTLAKRIKVYPQITKIMLQKSIEFFKNRAVDFSINISFDDIVSEEVSMLLFHLLEDSRVASRIVFELLETDRIEDHPAVTEFILKAKGKGARIAIDDFGSGYSNFDYILKIDVDYLKIDSSLIKNVDSDINSQILVETIVAFSRRLNIETIAEHVHNEDIFKKVKTLGIDYSQGFYLGEPKISV